MIEMLGGVSLLCLFLVIYHHAGHPLVLIIAGRLSGSKQGAPPQRHDWPSIAILIPAFNEEEFIGDKLETLAGLDYPADRLRIVVACDGCTDETAAIARESAARWAEAGLRIEVLDFADNRGKLAVLNAVIPTLDADLVALTDVSALISLDALKRVAARFADPDIGALVGTYKLFRPGGAGQGLYWRYQVLVKEMEARLGSVLGAHGAFYVIRKSLFKPLAPDTINDDFIIPMQIIAQGYQVGYDREIVALELEEVADRDEWRRRRRIAMGNIQQIFVLKNLLHPRFGWISFNFWGGKLLRTTTPLLLIVTFITSFGASFEFIFFMILFILQAVLYSGLAIAALLRPERLPRLGQLALYAASGHFATLLSWWDVMRTGEFKVAWARPTRV